MVGLLAVSFLQPVMDWFLKSKMAVHQPIYTLQIIGWNVWNATCGLRVTHSHTTGSDLVLLVYGNMEMVHRDYRIFARPINGVLTLMRLPTPVLFT